MNKRIIFKVIGIVLLLLSCLLYITTAIDGDEEPFIIGFFANIISIVFLILSRIFKKKEGISAPLPSQSADNIPIIDTMATNNTQVIIPDTCPHCKNPNTKRIRLCEWCGNQIV
jgi:hypothetical protein